MKLVYSTVLCCICLCLSMAIVTGLDSCETTLDWCMHSLHELDQKVSNMETMQNSHEGRVAAITQEVTDEITTLTKDLGSAKTVINLIVDDIVQIQGRVHTLQDVGDDVKGLHKQVLSTKNDLETQFADVYAKFAILEDSIQKQYDANRLITAMLNSEMNQNQKMLTDTHLVVEQNASKLSQLETKISTEETEILTEMSRKLDNTEQNYLMQINALKEQIQTLKRAAQ